MTEVAKCPKCGKSFDEAYDNTWCTKCGEPFPEEIKSHIPKLAAALAAETAAVAVSAEARSGSPVVNRYRDAYRVGAALVALGNGIKIGGAILAGVIALASLDMGAFAAAGFVVAAITGGLFWVCGVIVAAHGQTLRATLDTAVASSHFLTNPERADAMGLPRSVADHLDL